MLLYLFFMGFNVNIIIQKEFGGGGTNVQKLGGWGGHPKHKPLPSHRFLAAHVVRFNRLRRRRRPRISPRPTRSPPYT